MPTIATDTELPELHARTAQRLGDRLVETATSGTDAAIRAAAAYRTANDAWLAAWISRNQDAAGATR